MTKMTNQPSWLAGTEFTSETADVGGVTLHYVRGGSGPTMVLLHGFPQDCYEWRAVMPRLATTYTVVAVDLRGRRVRRPGRRLRRRRHGR